MNCKIVTHPVFGRGSVQASRYGGFELKVQFDRGVPRWVRLDQVELLQPESAQPADEPIQQTVRRRSRPRRIIESLRMGIVPDDCVDEFTFGRNQEVARLKEWLDSPDEGTMILVGPYGTGKTHLLNYMRSYALQESFAVSFVEMDAQETPFSKPKRVYSQLVQNLRLRTQPQAFLMDFRGLLREAFSVNLLTDHPYFQNLQSNISDDRLWEWIEARESIPRPWTNDHRYSNLPGLYDSGTAANIFCNLLSGFGWTACHSEIGQKGLLLIFDEAETLYMRQTPTAGLRSYNFLEALIATARGDADLPGNPKDTRFAYAGYAPKIPFLYRQPSGLKILLAFTSDSDFDHSPELSALPRLSLESLEQDALDQVFDQICSLYAKIYRVGRGALQTKAIRDIVGQETGPTRRLIKSYVEALDIMRFNQDKDPYEVLV